MHSQKLRKKEFRRNTQLESYLEKVNSVLWVSEERELKKFGKPKLPLVLIMGVPRSGTTVFFQWLAASGLFSYPSNFISRFFRAPFIGAQIQRLLADPELAFRNELRLDLGENSPNFSSELGKTEGFLSPNEFWYFWRRFFDYSEIQRIDKSEFRGKKMGILIRELAAFESVMKRPLLMKGMMFNWNIPELYSALPNVFFIFVERNPVSNARSILQARKKYFGDEKKWYSFKPPEFDALSLLSPVNQVVGQVRYTHEAIRAGLREIPESRSFSVSYESFCAHPRKVYQAIKKRLGEIGFETCKTYSGVSKFTVNPEPTTRLTQRIRKAFDFFENSDRREPGGD